MNVVAWFHKCPFCFSQNLQVHEVVEGEIGTDYPYDYRVYGCLECGESFDEHTHIPDETLPNWYVFIFDSTVPYCHEPYAVTLTGAELSTAMEYGAKWLESYPNSVLMLVWAESGAHPRAVLPRQGLHG